MSRTPLRLVAMLPSLMLLAPVAGSAQWTNRYPHVQGYGHHVYLEGYEMPFLTNGPIDPAPSPDGRTVAFASRGWIWVMDLRTGVARRITSGGHVDSRPAWHPSGQRLAFVRDSDHDTEIVVLDLQSGMETTRVSTSTIDLDPVFSADGRRLLHVSGRAGTLDVWSLDLASGESTPITDQAGIEMRPQPHPNGTDVLVLVKAGGDRVEMRSADGALPRVLLAGNIASMARPALDPLGRRVAVNWPTGDGWNLSVHDVTLPGAPIVLYRGGLPLTPAWGPEGNQVYFSEANEREVMELRRVAVGGGPVETLHVRAWDWGLVPGRLRIRTSVDGGEGPAPTRINVVDGAGHPALPDAGGAHFDGSSGRVFFYSSGVIEVSVPPGEAVVSAVQGLATPEETVSVRVAPGEVVDVDLALERVWDAPESGWASGDHHFHLNYGGPFDLDPRDLVPKMRGEGLDVATPLLANLHNRFEDQDLWTWEKSDARPLIRFGQEIRSHFLGHMGLIETPELHWPWVWGPGYEVYGTDDRTNGEVLAFAHDQGGIGYYVHPISVPDPFLEETRARTPVELVADAVLGDVDALEVVCLWSNSEGTAAMWHRFLNLGIPVAPSGGTDVMLDFYRTMAVGATRVYARSGGGLNWPSYVNALREGRSFVTNGPFLELLVGGAGPGEVTPGGPTPWSLTVATATEVQRVELIVNGSVVWSEAGLDEPGARTYSGTVDLPPGGWVAVRARGGETRWPSMDTAPFAHSAPVWIGERGSVDPESRQTAARELLAVLSASRARLVEGYGEADIPRLLSRFDAARTRLEGWIEDPR